MCHVETDIMAFEHASEQVRAQLLEAFSPFAIRVFQVLAFESTGTIHACPFLCQPFKAGDDMGFLLLAHKVSPHLIMRLPCVVCGCRDAVQATGSHFPHCVPKKRLMQLVLTPTRFIRNNAFAVVLLKDCAICKVPHGGDPDVTCIELMALPPFMTGSAVATDVPSPPA